MRFNIICSLYLMTTFIYGNKYIIDTNQSKVLWIGSKVTGQHYGTISIKDGYIETDNDSIVGGNIIIDDSYFDSERRIKSWRQKSGPQAYNAPLGALSFNFNTVQTFIQPAAKVGEKPIVIVVPDTDYIKVSNKAETVDNGRRNELIVNRLSRTGFNQVTISGKIRKNRLKTSMIRVGSVYIKKIFACENRRIYFGSQISGFLKSVKNTGLSA